MPIWRHPNMNFFLANAIVATVYFVLARLGLTTALPNALASPIWPAAGWALFAVFACGKKILPGIFIGSAAINFLQLNHLHESALPITALSACSIGLGAALQAQLGSLLMQKRATIEDWFQQTSEVFWFCVIAAASSLINSSIGTAITLLNELHPLNEALRLGVTWWFGDSVGILVVTPLLIALWQKRANEAITDRYFELTLLICSTFVLSHLLFGPMVQHVLGLPNFSLAFLISPILIWSAFRFPLLINTLIVLIISFMEVYGSFLSFAQLSAAELHRNLLLMQVIMGVAATISLTLNVMVKERDRIVTELAHANEHLEQRVMERTMALEMACVDLQRENEERQAVERALRVSEQRFRTLVEYAPEAIAVLDYDRKHFIDINENAVQLIKHPIEIMLGMGWDELSAPIQANNVPMERAVQPYYNEALEGGAPVFEWLILDADNKQIPCEVRFARLPSQHRTLLRISLIDISTRKQQDLLFEHERNILSLMASHAPVTQVLDALCGVMETQYPGSMCSVMVLDASEQWLTPLAGPSLPKALVQAISPIPVGPDIAACGTAAYRKETVIVEDTESDPLFGGQFRDLARQFNILSVWSAPILSSSGQLWGTLAIYRRERYRPDANEMDLVRRLTQHAGIAIQSHRRGEALRLSERRYRMLYDETPTMFFTLDPNGTVLSVNQFGADHLGFTVSDLIGRQFSTLHLPTDKLVIDDNIEKCQQLRPAMVTWEASRLCKDGREIRVRDRARAVPSFNQQIHLLIASEDITEAHRLAEKLSYQASHDPLTGLPNRREFEHQLQKLIESAQQEDIQHALFYVDLDQFKLVNDTCGHAAGDELLRQLATLLHQHTRKTDLLARLGGDEFGVLLERCSLEQASAIATNIRNAIAAFRFLWQDKIFSLGASIGVVAIDRHAEHLDGLLAAADTACYEAKEQGRNRIHVVRQNDETVLRRRGEMQWVSRIQRAYEEDRLQLFLQDIVPTQRPHGVHNHYEILLRMRDEAGQIIPPSAFLPSAERYNLAVGLDRWVVSTMCDWLNKHSDHLNTLDTCSINLSGHSLSNEEFLHFLSKQCRRDLVPPEKICFEITETVAIANMSKTMQFINELKDLGCRFALDDFGSGLSSFAYLKNLPVDYLKIDGFFVKDMAQDPIHHAMVKSINEVAKVMGKQTIAEFVETDEVYNLLCEMGVDYAQGYAISPPIPLEQALESILATRH